ncbi:MAG: hypothetical protein ACKVKH_06750 [Verrucomicrobiales bacterium]
MGDFVRGTPESLLKCFPAEVVDGIFLHRTIDRFAASVSGGTSSPPWLEPKKISPITTTLSIGPLKGSYPELLAFAREENPGGALSSP